MKKDKLEILLLIVTILFAFLAVFFYSQSKKIVLTTEIPYSETGSTSYKVHLSDSTYYNTEYLDEGMQYISSIVDYVDVDFKYNANYENVDKYMIYKKVTANIVITDSDNSDKIIYTKTDVLKDEKNNYKEINIDDSIKIDYTKYNNLVNEIKTKYGISANSVLNVDYNITYYSKDKGLYVTRKLGISMPLSKQMITITKGNNISEKGVYTGQEVGSTLNGLMALCSIIMVLLTISSGSAFVLRVRDRIRKESKYDRFIKKVLREYDSYITESSSDNHIKNKEVIKVNSFKELLDVRNNIDKTIVYTKIDNDTSKFELIDDEIYEYVVTRKEMDK